MRVKSRNLFYVFEVLISMGKCKFKGKEKKKRYGLKGKERISSNLVMSNN